MPTLTVAKIAIDLSEIRNSLISCRAGGVSCLILRVRSHAASTTHRSTQTPVENIT